VTSTHYINLSEQSTEEHDAALLVAAAGVGRQRLTQALHPLVRVEPAWRTGAAVLRAGRHVGTVRVGRLRVDVRPRLSGGEMVTLIRYALGGRVDAWQRSNIAAGRVGLDELLGAVLADELGALRQAGLSRQYVGRTEPLASLRGRPDFVASFPWNERGMTSLTCRFHDLTYDNLDNQLLRAALERATLLDTSVTTRRRLLEHRQVWSAAASLRGVGPQDFAAARQRYNRLSEHYRFPHRLAELLVLGRRPASLFEAAAVTTGGLSLDMAGLFELFLQRFLADVLGPAGLSITSQQTDQAALLDRDGFVYRSVRPDVVVYAGEKPVCVIDAKYKDYWEASADGSPARRVSNEDLYQLFFYAQRLQLRYRLPSPPAAVIIAPVPAADERGGQVVAGRFTRVTWQAGPDSTPCHLQLLLLPLTDHLRRLRVEKPRLNWVPELVKLFGISAGGGGG
jgi:5-methylcytosine-specific restriction enzyme subunit McrC